MVNGLSGKGCRSNGKNKNNLTYGEVSILSASRFSALSDENNREEEITKANQEQPEEGLLVAEVGHTIPGADAKKEEMASERPGPLRTTLPRSSKASGKTLESLTQNTRAAPSTSS